MITKADGLAAAATASTPAVYVVLGYQFEVAPMIAALTACFVTRLYIRQKIRALWTLELPIMTLALLVTAAAIVSTRPSLILSIVTGIGFGVLGARILRISEGHVERILTGGEDAKTTDDADEMQALLDKLDERTQGGDR